MRKPASFGDAFARTRVARRIVLLFMLCAIGPVASLAAISYVSVRGQLRERAADRLYRGSKATGLGLLQRLQSLEWELSRIATRMTAAASVPAGRWAVPDAAPHFRAIGFSVPGKSPLPGVPDPDAAAVSHLREGKAAVYANPGPRGVPRIVMAILPDTADAGTIAWAEVESAWLWAPPLTADALPEPELCVVRGSDALFCPPRTAPRIRSAGAGRAGADITFEWESEDGTWLAASWPLFMRYSFAGPDWMIISSEPVAVVMAPLRDFSRAYLLILCASLVLVALLSLITIRRNMDPLADLHAATRRIAARDFNTRVEVRTNDEFRVLADSFNAMASGLGRQFEAMNGMLGLGQRLLSVRDAEGIARAAIEEVRTVVPCRAAALLLRPGFCGRDDAGGWVRVADAITAAGPWDPAGAGMPIDGTTPRTLGVIGPGPGPLPERLTAQGAATHLLYPLVVGGEAIGVFALALDGGLSAEDALYARQLTDSVAVALGAADLFRELNDLSWGALRALARAIDAKSHWTAGHSDRVTTLAIALGRRLGLDGIRLEQLERGGLLHDVGKIGVSNHILDKPGALTPEEWQEMRSHTTLGGRILEPVTRYADIVPIVLHHHERWDGGGYPSHLAGDAIPYLARVLAFADVYDALTSDRPYRAGMTQPMALSVIEAGLGSHFDREIGRVFLSLMSEGEPAGFRAGAPKAGEILMAAVPRH